MSANLIYGQEGRLLPWALERIGIDAFRDDAVAIGIERDGEIVGVAVYDCFSSKTCNMHVASDGTKRWLNKQFLAAVFAYPFMQCKFNSVVALISERNEEAIRFNLAIGFKHVGVLHMAASDGGDIVVSEMLRMDCRWIPEECRK